MKVKFWGTRGSLPASSNSDAIRRKVTRALQLARGHSLHDDQAIQAFIDTLPFAVRGTYGTNTACVQIVSDTAEHVFCDCGSGLRDYSTQQSSPHTPAVYHFFLSHLHWDHLQGFPFFQPAYIEGNRIVIHSGHREAEAALRMQMQSPVFPVSFDMLKADLTFETHSVAHPFQVAGFEVGMFEQRHPGTSYGYRFEKAGRSIVYSTDSEHKDEAAQPDYPFLRFIRDADLLIFDAMYSLADALYSKEDWGHSSNIMAVELAARAAVKTLVLFHQDPTSSDEELDRFIHNSRLHSELFQQKKSLATSDDCFPQEILLASDGLEIAL